MQNFISYIKDQDSKFIFLALMLIVLPSFEVPKNLFAVLFVVSWAVISYKNKDWGGKWRAIDTIFLLWILADIAVGVNAVLVHDQPANGSKDIIKFVLVGWAISRSGFSNNQMINLSVVAIIFAVMPLIYSYLNCNGGSCIELNSVGHVNHTAIYLLIAYVLSLSLLIFNFKNISNSLRIVLIVTSIALAYTVIDTNSRAASAMLAAITLMAALYSIYHYRNWCSIIISVSLISLAAVSLTYNPPAVITKFINGSNLIGDSPRQKIRNFSYYIFKIDPVFGTGIGNFPNFNHDHIKDLVIKDKGVFNKGEFMPYAHPHNVYYVYLTGGGIILLTVFVWFWLQVINIIYQINRQSNEKWIIFAATSTVLVVLSIGWVNTTLAHEHALITMFAIGLLISKHREIV